MSNPIGFKSFNCDPISGRLEMIVFKSSMKKHYFKNIIIHFLICVVFIYSGTKNRKKNCIHL